MDSEAGKLKRQGVRERTDDRLAKWFFPWHIVRYWATKRTDFYHKNRIIEKKKKLLLLMLIPFSEKKNIISGDDCAMDGHLGGE